MTEYLSDLYATMSFRAVEAEAPVAGKITMCLRSI